LEGCRAHTICVKTAAVADDDPAAALTVWTVLEYVPEPTPGVSRRAGVQSATRRSSSSSSMPISAGIQGGDAAAAGRAESSAPHHQPFRHVRTLSDDEDYLVAASAITESDVDTEELIGRVDWSLAANSDDDHDVPPG